MRTPPSNRRGRLNDWCRFCLPRPRLTRAVSLCGWGKEEPRWTPRRFVRRMSCQRGLRLLLTCLPKTGPAEYIFISQSTRLSSKMKLLAWHAACRFVPPRGLSRCHASAAPDQELAKLALRLLGAHGQQGHAHAQASRPDQGAQAALVGQVCSDIGNSDTYKRQGQHVDTGLVDL